MQSARALATCQGPFACQGAALVLASTLDVSGTLRAGTEEPTGARPVEKAGADAHRSPVRDRRHCASRVPIVRRRVASTLDDKSHLLAGTEHLGSVKTPLPPDDRTRPSQSQPRVERVRGTTSDRSDYRSGHHDDNASSETLQSKDDASRREIPRLDGSHSAPRIQVTTEQSAPWVRVGRPTWDCSVDIETEMRSTGG